MKDAPLTMTYAFIATTAPPEYDYGATIPIDSERIGVESLPTDIQLMLYERPWRGVMVPIARYEYQRDRYLSGAHFAYVVPA